MTEPYKRQILDLHTHLGTTRYNKWTRKHYLQSFSGANYEAISKLAVKYEHSLVIFCCPVSKPALLCSIEFRQITSQEESVRTRSLWSHDENGATALEL